MADYKELLRRAVEALPENNGAARRAVYEKARAALVGQLRAINPPLAARDITTHRLQLEDCIRQVEQEASEANIAGMVQDTPRLPPVFAAEAKKPAMEPRKQAAPPAAEKPARPERARAAPQSASIEDIIAEADFDAEAERPVRAPEAKSKQQPKPPVSPRPEPAAPSRAAQGRPEMRALPSIVARAEAAKGRSAGPSFSANLDGARRQGAAVEAPRRDGRAAVAAKVRPAEYEDIDDDFEAMTAVREVEVEHSIDPQGTIDRAIATLDREARGDADDLPDIDLDYDDEPQPPPRRNGAVNGKANGRATGTDLVVSRIDAPPRRGREPSPEREPAERKKNDRDRDRGRSRPAKEFANPRRAQAARAFDGMPRSQPERRGLGAVAIFSIIFATLLVGAGGAGFWAYTQGYLDFQSAFGGGNAAVATQTPAETPAPGNTNAAQPETTEPAAALRSDDRLPTTAATSAEAAPLALQSPAGSGERLGTAQDATAAEVVANVDPGTISGSQSLLLEASDNGGAGAVPFSGTVEWSKGADEIGQPTLVGKANIPARNLSVEILIRKNADPALPASHLMEINFIVSDTFIGGSIAGLPGVLLKDQELVQGVPLVGASARVVGNSFLFALSAAAQDGVTNANLLTSRKWMDLALIYASGKRAIITLEKDAAAQALFSEVFAAWGAAAPSSAG